MRFWDREREKEWLKKYLQTEPNAILFVYGPKSSGKSTLLMKVAQELKEEPFKFLWYDLRKYAIEKAEDAISILLGAKGMHSSLAKLFDIQLVFISLKTEEALKVFKKEKDPFVLMEEELLKIRDRGGMPVIVFDELQNLKDIYLNGERRLIDRLFNFFVAMAKVDHLAHVVVMTSDTFLIEEVYTSSALKNTSEYYLVDYFDDDTALRILIDEGVSREDAEYVVSIAGGVPWIMAKVISSKSPKEKVKAIYEQVSSRIFEAVRGREDLKEILRRALSGENLYYEERNIEGVKELVEREVLFFDPINKVVRFQTKLDERAARELIG